MKLPLLLVFGFLMGAALPARVVSESSWVTAADGGSARVGLVKRDSVVMVTRGCEDGGTAQLGDDGQVSCAVLSFIDAGEPSSVASWRWGKVSASGAQVFEAPDAGSRLKTRLEAPYSVALIDDAELFSSGWAERVLGGYLRLTEIKEHIPSQFSGVVSPVLPLAFVYRATSLSMALREGPTQSVAKYERFEVLEENSRTVRTPQGLLPRDAVGVARKRARHVGIPAQAKWIHVDVSEQVLTAYEADSPVFVTLVSTGQSSPKSWRTRKGLFKVWNKSLHDRMHGEGYFVEEVPWILFFNRGQGLHGTFWHESFGRRVSHGCVNLSMADAKWLFDWAPPQLPMGWHTVIPEAKMAETLWVWVE